MPTAEMATWRNRMGTVWAWDRCLLKGCLPKRLRKSHMIAHGHPVEEKAKHQISNSTAALFFDGRGNRRPEEAINFYVAVEQSFRRGGTHEKERLTAAVGAGCRGERNGKRGRMRERGREPSMGRLGSFLRVGAP